MADNLSPSEENDQVKTTSGFTIDLKRVFFRALRFWYVMLICLGLGLAGAAVVTRYTPAIYPVTTSLIIRETEETSGAELLYKNALIDPYRNYLNEPYIIRSYSLLQTVVEDLGFWITFYREGEIVTSEIYDIPVKIKLPRPAMAYGFSAVFKIINGETYTLELKDQPATQKTFHFNDTAFFAGQNLYVERKADRDYQYLVGTPLTLVISNPAWLTGGYVGGLTVKWAEEGAGVIILGLSGPNPAKDIDFLNGLIKNYQRYDLDKKNRAADRTIRFIRGQLYHIADSLGFSESQIENFKIKKDEVVLDLTDESRDIYSRIRALEAQQTELILRGRYFDYLEDYVKKNQSLDQIILPSSMAINDPIIVNQITKMIQLQSENSLYINADNNDNTTVKKNRKSIDQIRKEIIEAVATLRVTDKIKADFLNGQMKTVEGKLNAIPQEQRKFVKLERNYQLLEGLYIFLNQKMAEAQISMASNISDIIVVNPPMQGSPISPKPTQNFVFGGLIGLLIPLAFFALMEGLDNKVQSKDDIDKLTQIPFIGGVGHTKSGSKLVVFDKPKSAVAESFRALRSNLSYFTGSAEKKIFMITSSIGGEGKTFTTINLACVLCLSDKKILVVGADMRKPKLFEDFGVDNSIGLSNYLSGSVSFDKVVRATKVPGIDIISGGPVPPNPAELLMTPLLDDFFKIALEKYDFILLDTPPIAIVSDAMILTKFADHVIFVIRQGYSPKHFLQNIQEYYQSGRINKVSILLNDITKTGPGYGYNSYGYSYGYGYGYGQSKKKDGHGYYNES